MPRNPQKEVEAFIDEVDLIMFDDSDGTVEELEDKLRRIRVLCADTRLAIMVEELS